MRETLLRMIRNFLRKHAASRRWRTIVTVLAAAAVFCTTYALILPAITVTADHPSVEAEVTTAWSGDELELKVSASAGDEDKIIVITGEGENADLSPSYVFDEDGHTVITDEAGNSIILSRSVRQDRKGGQVFDYWFSLDAGEATVFTLAFVNEVDMSRTAVVAEAVRKSAGLKEDEADTHTDPASPSDAVREGKAAHDTASPANADAGSHTATASGAERPLSAGSGETEVHDDGFVELLDGTVIDDITDSAEAEDMTEIMAKLKVSAGSGTDYEAAVKDAEKNADKRGDAQVVFYWKDVTMSEENAPTLIWTGDGVQIAVYCDSDAGLPEDAKLSVREIEQGSDEYYTFVDEAESAVQEEGTEKEVGFARFFDIKILDADDAELEPDAPVRVIITYNEAISDVAADDLNIVHFHEGKETEIFKPETDADEASALSFTADTFSIYGVVGTTIEKNILASDGHSYTVNVTCSTPSRIPRDAELDVREIIPGGGTEYDMYLTEAESALGVTPGSVRYARFFDISILNSQGEKIQPAEGSTVDVKISLTDAEQADFNVIHFGNSAEFIDTVKAETAEGCEFTFAAGSFSVYAIVQAPEPVTVERQKATSTGELEDGIPFYISYNAPEVYTTGELNSNSAFIESSSYQAAAKWYFEPAETGDGFYIYTYSDGSKHYMHNKSANLMALSQTNRTRFTVEPAGNGKFYLKTANADKWLQHSKSGNGMRLFTDHANATNSKLDLWYADTFTVGNDPYNLNGKSFGIAFNDDSVTAAAMTAEGTTAGSTKRLKAEDMMIRPNILDNMGPLLVSADSDITMWTFESAGEDQYYIYTVVDGLKKYIQINKTSVSLVEDRDGASLITARPGTGANAGKWKFSVNGYALRPVVANGSASGFGGSSANDTYTWLNLVERSILSNDDFNRYTAKKVSVSDEANVYDTQQVIIYTRIWNNDLKKYEFYAVDHDGTLLKCYDAGDTIEWIGSRIHTALWDFTEYLNPDGTKNYYYELQNAQYGNYIAPQITGGQVFSDGKLGINLNGRRYSENYTTIIAWDDRNYTYAGLKVENGRVVSCPLAEADDFYFAVINPIDTTDELTTVQTVDGTEFGITMRMIDYQNPKTNDNRDTVLQSYFGGDNNSAGLLTTDLKANGYPDSTSVTGHAGQSLSALYSGASEVNHLLIESIYNESGYFQYSSTSNFAHLNPDGTFKVYDQLGSIGDYMRDTAKHGQFMPYDDLTPGKYCTFKNTKDIFAAELPDLDPRKGETLYNIGGTTQVNYQFGMEMEASFTQTVSGRDAWGHDIVFEFSGDDDFWFYVDGELVLDLGGVHSAMAGSINFRTGVVKSSRGDSTLYNIFRSNYQKRGLSAAEIDEKLDELFELNEDNQYVFKDFSTHTMKMFYMERGAGASNLSLRFNLTAVKPGQITLKKTISGTERPDYNYAEFPYQIYYKMEGEDTFSLLDAGSVDGHFNVVYQQHNTPVKFRPSFTPTGSQHSYDNVFLLKPGETALINVPDSTIEYYIVECGVNTDIYDVVSINNVESTGTEVETGRKDFSTGISPVTDRASVEFDNHVDENAVRTMQITKKLYDASGRFIPAAEDPQGFSFRLYLGTENDQAPALCNMEEYLVKDPDGNYCVWDPAGESFQSIGKSDYTVLTESEKDAATFTSSQNGQISKIPSGYSVEIRNLVVGTKFKVEERESDIPTGYRLYEYYRVNGSYIAEDGDTLNSGIIRDNSNPVIEVHNRRGWGITLRKEWEDRNFVLSHGSTYFAVFTDDGNTPVPGTVRELAHPETSLYWYFDSLETGTSFADYRIREVELTDPVTDADGNVTSYTSLTAVPQDGTVHVDMTPSDGSGTIAGMAYTAHYTTGTPTGTGSTMNVRTDTAVNSRPGIKLIKTDMSGNPLGGAVFTLTDSIGGTVGASSKTSGADGLIETAYLADGQYTLTEVTSPAGYSALEGTVTLTVTNGRLTSAVGPSGALQILQEGGNDVLKIRNKPYTLQVKKVTADTSAPLAGAHFALYREVTSADGTPVHDYTPMAGYEDMVSQPDGTIAEITGSLPAGSYYLYEKEAPQGYAIIRDLIRFTITASGDMTVDAPYSEWLTETEGSTNARLLEIKNAVGELEVVFKKTERTPAGTALGDAVFSLREQGSAAWLYTGLTSGPDGILRDGLGKTSLVLPFGTYELVETDAPDGYTKLTDPVVITIRNDGVSYMQQNYRGGAAQDAIVAGTKYTVSIINYPGYELPHTGGLGAELFYAIGAFLIAAGFTVPGKRRRRKRRRKMSRRRQNRRNIPD